MFEIKNFLSGEFLLGAHRKKSGILKVNSLLRTISCTRAILLFDGSEKKNPKKCRRKIYD